MVCAACCHMAVVFAVSVMHFYDILNILLHLSIPFYTFYQKLVLTNPPQWGAADAEIKVTSVENTELKAWSRSVHSHTYYAYCQGFLPC